MSRQQREKIDVMLRQPRPEGPPPSVEELRAGFAAALSAIMIVPSGFRTSTTILGGRPALSVEPDQRARPGGRSCTSTAATTCTARQRPFCR
jgi:epsilon-lactone hydrolase